MTNDAGRCFTKISGSGNTGAMKRLLWCLSGALALVVAGCQSEMVTVATLANQEAPTPVRQTTTAPEKGTYYLYSSKSPKDAAYHVDLKKGDELGFVVTGNRAQALAKGILIELSEYSEGADYTWKYEPEKKKE